MNVVVVIAIPCAATAVLFQHFDCASIFIDDALGDCSSVWNLWLLVGFAIAAKVHIPVLGRPCSAALAVLLQNLEFARCKRDMAPSIAEINVVLCNHLPVRQQSNPARTLKQRSRVWLHPVAVNPFWPGSGEDERWIKDWRWRSDVRCCLRYHGIRLERSSKLCIELLRSKDAPPSNGSNRIWIFFFIKCFKEKIRWRMIQCDGLGGGVEAGVVGAILLCTVKRRPGARIVRYTR